MPKQVETDENLAGTVQYLRRSNLALVVLFGVTIALIKAGIITHKTPHDLILFFSSAFILAFVLNANDAFSVSKVTARLFRYQSDPAWRAGGWRRDYLPQGSYAVVWALALLQFFSVLAYLIWLK